MQKIKKLSERELDLREFFKNSSCYNVIWLGVGENIGRIEPTEL